MSSRTVIWKFVMAGLLPISFLGAAEQSADSLVKQGKATRALQLPPAKDNPRNSEGDFITLKDGRILFVYTHFTDGAADHSSAFLAGRYSSDGGKTWTAEDETIMPNDATAAENAKSVETTSVVTGRPTGAPISRLRDPDGSL